jgi:hypothetical protein
LVESRELDLAAERNFVGKILACEGLVYDHHLPGGVHVIFGENPAMEQGDSESLKILLADGFLLGLPALRVRPTGNNDVRRVKFQRGLFIAFRGGEHTGNCFYPVKKLAGD